MFKGLEAMGLSLEGINPDVPEPDTTVEYSSVESPVVGTPYRIGSMLFVLEYLKGDIRKGVAPDGTAWESPMPAHYGHVYSSIGGDAELLDIYIKPDVKDVRAKLVYIVDQITPELRWDEHKAMLGFDTADEAESTYASAFNDGKGRDRIGATTIIPFQCFTDWLESTGTQAAVAGQGLPGSTVRHPGQFVANVVVAAPGTGSIVKIPRPGAEGEEGAAAAASKRVRFGAELVKLPPMNSFQIVERSVEDGFEYDVYIYGIISPWSITHDRLGDLLRLLRQAPEGQKFSIFIASPGGYLDIAQDIVSAMRDTKAHVTTVAVGQIASAATFIWANGHTLQVWSNACVMQHMSTHGDYGLSSGISKRAALLTKYVRDNILQGHVDRGLFTEEEVSNMVDRGTDIYVGAAEMQRRIAAAAAKPQE